MIEIYVYFKWSYKILLKWFIIKSKNYLTYFINIYIYNHTKVNLNGSLVPKISYGTITIIYCFWFDMSAFIRIFPSSKVCIQHYNPKLLIWYGDLAINLFNNSAINITPAACY